MPNLDTDQELVDENRKASIYFEDYLFNQSTPTYTLATLPTVSDDGGVSIYVSDATGASLTGSLCFSNGTVWIDVTTGAAVA